MEIVSFPSQDFDAFNYITINIKKNYIYNKCVILYTNTLHKIIDMQKVVYYIIIIIIIFFQIIFILY